MRSGLSMSRGVAVGLAGSAALAGVVSCTAGPGAAAPGPTVTVTVTATERSLTFGSNPTATATVTVTPSADAAARLRAVREQAVRVGAPPPENEVGVVPDGTRHWFVWVAPDGRFCTGVLGEAVRVSCGPDVSSGPKPGVTAVVMPVESSGAGNAEWVAFLVAEGEQVRGLRCGQSRIGVTEVQGFASADGRRRLYLAPPNSAFGDLKADVLRPDGSSLFDQVRSLAPADRPGSGKCTP